MPTSYSKSIQVVSLWLQMTFVLEVLQLWSWPPRSTKSHASTIWNAGRSINIEKWRVIMDPQAKESKPPGDIFVTQHAHHHLPLSDSWSSRMSIICILVWLLFRPQTGIYNLFLHCYCIRVLHFSSAFLFLCLFRGWISAGIICILHLSFSSSAQQIATKVSMVFTQPVDQLAF